MSRWSNLALPFGGQKWLFYLVRSKSFFFIWWAKIPQPWFTWPQTHKIIGSNDQGNPKFLVYPDTKSTDNVGGINTAMLAGAGTDTLLFVSGSISGKELSTPNTVSIFGGDLVVSGALYAENSLYVTGSSVFNSNKTGDSDFIINLW